MISTNISKIVNFLFSLFWSLDLQSQYNNCW